MIAAPFDGTIASWDSLNADTLVNAVEQQAGLGRPGQASWSDYMREALTVDDGPRGDIAVGGDGATFLHLIDEATASLEMCCSLRPTPSTGISRRATSWSHIPATRTAPSASSISTHAAQGPVRSTTRGLFVTARLTTRPRRLPVGCATPASPLRASRSGRLAWYSPAWSSLLSWNDPATGPEPSQRSGV